MSENVHISKCKAQNWRNSAPPIQHAVRLGRRVSSRGGWGRRPKDNRTNRSPQGAAGTQEQLKRPTETSLFSLACFVSPYPALLLFLDKIIFPPHPLIYASCLSPSFPSLFLSLTKILANTSRGGFSARPRGSPLLASPAPCGRSRSRV